MLPNEHLYFATAFIDSTSAALRSLSLTLHDSPELSFQEFKAHDLLTSFLTQEGFTVERNAYGLKTAFKASFVYALDAKGAKTIGFCAEYDALPGLGHACGHNLIAITSIGAALAFKALITRFKIPANIIIYGTPGEETTGGKILMIESGAFRDLDICLMAHPANEDAVYGHWLALAVFTVEYFGKSAHASAEPWEGINALDAAVQCYSSLALLRQQMLPSNRLHCVILNGGLRANIIPDYAKLEIYVRAQEIEDLNIMEDKTRKCIEAAATGCTFSISADPVFANVKVPRIITQHNPQLASLYESYMAQTGSLFKPIYIQQQASRGSTDMGNVTQIVPGIHPVFDIGCAAAYHTVEFCIASASDVAHEKSMNAARALCLTALEYVISTER